MRIAAKVDANHKEIVSALRKLGFSVANTHQVGRGFPDIVVGQGGKNYLFEIKDGSKCASQRRLTEDEAKFGLTWKGQVNVVCSIDDILRVMRACPKLI